ncbi:hypothetical protein [Ruminiclostridium cellulolyticum]|uniref:hypothetical protein n=1 Tax=Ruminiclostridium cellulolyticum TaxID=1521 RepID=UPI0005A0945A|nr:hypothetical protein [Ruminiclostridium cellulolyticum]
MKLTRARGYMPLVFCFNRKFICIGSKVFLKKYDILNKQEGHTHYKFGRIEGGKPAYHSGKESRK